MSVTRLVLLGVLSWQPMHGYEIKHIIEEHMGDWTDIKFGSIYFALARLAEEGAIAIAEELRSGNRPSRTVYTITDKGRAEYQSLLRALWSQPQETYHPLDIGLFFVDSLPPEEVVGYIQQQIELIQAKLAYLKGHKADHEQDVHVPRQALLIMDHAITQLEAELRWLDQVQTYIQHGQETQ